MKIWWNFEFLNFAWHMQNLEFASYMYPIECKGKFNSYLVEPENKKNYMKLFSKWLLIISIIFLKTQCTDIEYVDIAKLFTEWTTCKVNKKILNISYAFPFTKLLIHLRFLLIWAQLSFSGYPYCLAARFSTWFENNLLVMEL